MFDFEIISRILKITHSSKVRVVSVVVVFVVVFVLHIGYIATLCRIVSNAISLQSRNSCLLEHNVENTSNLSGKLSSKRGKFQNTRNVTVIALQVLYEVYESNCIFAS